MKEYLQSIQPGDTIHRMLAGVIPMDLIVDEVTDDKIIAKGGWEFSRETGVEIDDMISCQVSHLVQP